MRVPLREHRRCSTGGPSRSTSSQGVQSQRPLLEAASSAAASSIVASSVIASFAVASFATPSSAIVAWLPSVTVIAHWLIVVGCLVRLLAVGRG